MSTETTTPEAGTETPSTPPEGTATTTGTETKPSAFDDVIGGLDEAAQQVILDRIKKPNSEARQLRERLKELEPKATEYDKLLDERKTELEKAQEAASKAAERTASLLTQVATSKIEALAASGFADPDDAVALLGDPSKFVGEDGSVNSDAIKEQLADLLARKPHLGKPSAPGLPGPHEAQGASGGGTTQTLDAQIAEAEANRDFTRSIALKQQRAALNKTKP